MCGWCGKDTGKRSPIEGTTGICEECRDRILEQAYTRDEEMICPKCGGRRIVSTGQFDVYCLKELFVCLDCGYTDIFEIFEDDDNDSE